MTQPAQPGTSVASGAPRSLWKAAAAGSVTALVCASGWGCVLGFWELRSALLGVSAGIFVGLAVRIVGRRSDPRIMLLGGALSLWACLLGNLVGFAIAASRARGLSAAEAIVILASHGGEFLIEDALTPLNLVACLVAGIAGAIVSKRGSDPQALMTLMGAAGGAHIHPGDLGPPEGRPAQLRPPPADLTPVVEKRLPLRHGKPGNAPKQDGTT